MEEQKDNIGEIIDSPGELLGKVSPELYWEFRTDVAELEAAKSELALKESLYNSMLKDIEISRLKVALFKTTLNDFQQSVNLRKKSLDEIRERISNSLNISITDLNKSIINESFQVVKLDEKS